MKFCIIRYVSVNITKTRPISLKVLLALMFLSLIIYSCKNEKEEFARPSISIVNEAGFIYSDSTFSAGAQMPFKIRAKGDGLNLTNFIIKVMTDTMRTYIDTGFNSLDFSWEGKFAKTFSPIENWHFIIRDRYGNSDEQSLQIFLDTAQNFKVLENYSLSLGAQANTSEGSFFSFNTGNNYTLAECVHDAQVQSVIDLLYYYGPDNATIASPGANVESGIFEGDLLDWTVRNTSRFLSTTLLPEDFMKTTNDSILIVLWDEGEAKRKAKNLSNGSIYIFKTHEDRLGLFLVNTMDAGNQGSIEFDVKIQTAQ